MKYQIQAYCYKDELTELSFSFPDDDKLEERKASFVEKLKKAISDLEEELEENE